jgi:sugar/nucleoside kinase (ribokinase family)
MIKKVFLAIKFANKCSAWVVTQKGVVVVDLNEVKL